MIAVITIFQVERNGFGDKIVKTSAKNAVFSKKPHICLPPRANLNGTILEFLTIKTGNFERFSRSKLPVLRVYFHDLSRNT